LRDIDLKIKCIKCKTSDACWFYEMKSNKGYCEDCVNRDCGCQFNEEINDYYRDELGRILPCVDYIYFEEGIEDD
jgi:hypothetical protein